MSDERESQKESQRGRSGNLPEHIDVHQYVGEEPKCVGKEPIDEDQYVVPNPGSDEAWLIGCLCPVLDNNHGRGYMGQENVFIYRANCPVHRPELFDDQ